MLEFDGKYECKLSTRAVLGIEKALGDNPVNLIFKDDEIPTLTVMLTILWYSMRKENPQVKSVNDVIDIYDEYLDNGGSLSGLAKFIIELIEDSGMMKREDESNIGEDTGKN